MTESIVIRDASGQALSDVYFENEPQWQQMSVMVLAALAYYVSLLITGSGVQSPRVGE